MCVWSCYKADVKLSMFRSQFETSRVSNYTDTL